MMCVLVLEFLVGLGFYLFWGVSRRFDPVGEDPPCAPLRVRPTEGAVGIHHTRCSWVVDWNVGRGEVTTSKTQTFHVPTWAYMGTVYGGAFIGVFVAEKRLIIFPLLQFPTGVSIRVVDR